MTLDERDEKQERKEHRKRKRWGEAVKPAGTATATTAVMQMRAAQQQPAGNAAGDLSASFSVDPKANILAMQESIRARLAAAKAMQQQTATTAAQITLKRPLPRDEALKPVIKRAKVYELDLSVTAPMFQEDSAVSTTTKVAAFSKAPAATSGNRKPANPYLAHKPDEEEHDEAIDDRLQRASKPRKRHKDITFVEPGKWQEIAALKRERELKAVASGYTSGRKAGHTIQAPTLSDIYTGSCAAAAEDDDGAPRADANYDTKMPVAMEWWDMELLPSKLKKLVAAEESKVLTKQTTASALNSFGSISLKNSGEGDEDAEDTKKGDTEAVSLESLRVRCFEQAALSYSRTAALVQHIVPVKPPNAERLPKKQPVLHLTKKELKRQRKLRRQEKQRELQDLQAAGLIPAPEPRLTLRNFIQVLGDQAFLDPSQIEQKVQEQVQARHRAHLERNESAKLTKKQRAAKRTHKYEEDTTTSVATAIFFVKDMSHPYHRTKIDLNAQQLNLSGCVLECSQDPSFACVIVEGGPKAIKRYARLMLFRMKWTGLDDEDEDPVEHDVVVDDVVTAKFNPANECKAVWQGMSIKRLFHGFLFQSCETHEQARKILKAKGASNYWDQVFQHASGQSDKFQLKLAEDSDDDVFQQVETDVLMADT